MSTEETAKKQEVVVEEEKKHHEEWYFSLKLTIVAKWKEESKLVQFFSGDTLLFEKQRNDYHIEPDDFVVKFLLKRGNEEPVILFNEEHGFITVLNIKGETLFKYDMAGSFITSVTDTEEFLVFEGWVWQPIYFISIIPIQKFLENIDDDEHLLFNEFQYQAMDHFDWTDTHLIFKKVDGTKEFIPWKRIYEEEFQFEFDYDYSDKDETNSPRITNIEYCHIIMPTQ
jgi:hypothetical protein